MTLLVVIDQALLPIIKSQVLFFFIVYKILHFSLGLYKKVVNFIYRRSLLFKFTVANLVLFVLNFVMNKL